MFLKIIKINTIVKLNDKNKLYPLINVNKLANVTISLIMLLNSFVLVLVLIKYVKASRSFF